MTEPKDPKSKLLTRDRASKILGVSVSTFRRRYEGKMVQPDVIDGVHYFNPTHIEEIVKEEHPPLTPDEMTVAILRTSSLAAAEGLDAGVDAMVRSNQILEQAWKGILAENERLTKRIESLETREIEFMKMIDEIRKARFDQTIADAEAKKILQRNQTLMQTFKLLAPAAAAAIIGGTALKEEAVGSLLESIEPEQSDAFMQAASGILNADQMSALMLILSKRDSKRKKEDQMTKKEEADAS